MLFRVFHGDAIFAPHHFKMGTKKDVPLFRVSREARQCPESNAKTRVRHYRRTCLKRNGFYMEFGVFSRVHRLKICNLQVFNFSKRRFLELFAPFVRLETRLRPIYTADKAFANRCLNLSAILDVTPVTAGHGQTRIHTDGHRATHADLTRLRSPQAVSITAVLSPSHSPPTASDRVAHNVR